MGASRRHVVAVGIAMLLSLGLSLVSVGTAAAQADPTTVTIHLSQCPAGYEGNDPFTDCHPNGIPGVTFRWRIPENVPWSETLTDENGIAVIESTGKTFTIEETPPFDLASYAVSCSTNDGADQVLFNSFEPDVSITFPVGALTGIADVVCDWYNTPVAATDGGSTIDGGTTMLPNTGVGDARGGDTTDPGLLLAAALLTAGGVGFSLRRRTSR